MGIDFVALQVEDLVAAAHVDEPHQGTATVVGPEGHHLTLHDGGGS